MPPKKQNKPDKNKQQKAVVDKTFGMKNKKGSAAQKTIKGIKNSIMGQGKSEQKMMEEQQKAKEEKKKAAEEKALMASLFNVVKPKAGGAIDKDADPKTQLCQFFKQGLCQKGRKCKYSHDLNIENQNKTQVINLYQDQREQLSVNKEEDENMDNWDTDKLNQVVSAQQNKYKSQVPTEIVCKYFLDAINNNKYGWKWVCPNGMKCHYRHCLPPGFILKKDVQKKEKEDLSKMEEKIDEQIASLSFKGKQKVTYEVFLEWKRKRKEKKEKEKLEKEKEKQKATKKKAGGKNHGMSGLAIFMENPDMFQDEDEGDDDIDYTQRADEEFAGQQSRWDTTDYDKFSNFKPRDRREDEFKDQEAEERKIEEEPEQEQQVEEQKEEEVPESWDQAADEDQEKKKKKKKKKKSGDVKINDDAFLDDA